MADLWPYDPAIRVQIERYMADPERCMPSERAALEAALEGSPIMTNPTDEALSEHEGKAIRGLFQTINRKEEALRQQRTAHDATKVDAARYRAALMAIQEVTGAALAEAERLATEALTDG